MEAVARAGVGEEDSTMVDLAGLTYDKMVPTLLRDGCREPLMGPGDSIVVLSDAGPYFRYVQCRDVPKAESEQEMRCICKFLQQRDRLSGIRAPGGGWTPNCRGLARHLSQLGTCTRAEKKYSRLAVR